MYECVHCGAKAVIWDENFDFEIYGYEGEGVIRNYHCTNCGVEIEYRVPMESDEDGQKVHGSN